MEVENNKELVPFAHYCDQWKEMDPAARSAESGVPYDAETGTFTVTLLGVTYHLHWPEFAIDADGGAGFALQNIPAQILLMRYVMESKPVPFGGKFLTFREMPWGDVYIKPFTGRCLTRAAFTFGTRLPAFRAAMEKMGAAKVDHGDAGYQVEFLPGLFMQILVWEGDDEFPPNSQILFSDNFAEAFAAEDRVVCADILIGDGKCHM